MQWRDWITSVKEGGTKQNHWRNQQPDLVWDFVHQGRSSGLSRMLPWCSIWSTPTKTPGDLSQFLGKYCSFLSILSQVSNIKVCLVAFLPYLLLVEEMSSRSQALIVASHLLCISRSLGHSSSGLSSWILTQHSFQIRCMLSDIRMWYTRAAPGRVFPLSILNLINPHPITALIFASSGQVSCFLSYSSWTPFRITFWPGMSQCSRKCSRLSVVLHFWQFAWWP